MEQAGKERLRRSVFSLEKEVDQLHWLILRVHAELKYHPTCRLSDDAKKALKELFQARNLKVPKSLY